MIGLIQYEMLSEYIRNFTGREVTVRYFGKLLSLRLPEDKTLRAGGVRFTHVAHELMPIVCSGLQPVEGFFEYVKEYWKEYAPVEMLSTVVVDHPAGGKATLTIH